MSLLFEIVGRILLGVIHVMVEVPLIWLGEIVWWAVTLGRHQPRWDCYTEEYGGDGVLLSRISFGIGAVSVAALGLCVKAFCFDSQ